MTTWWAFPSWSGDIRLKAAPAESYRDADAPDGKCVLEIDTPIPIEIEAMTKFLKVALKKKWIDEAVEVTPPPAEGKAIQEVPLNIDLDTAGKELLHHLKPPDRTITAVKVEGGKVTVHDTEDLLAKENEDIKKKGTKTVSTKRATLCCPQCVPGPMDRASEVLHEFLRPEQRQSWETDRFVIATGNLSGHRYVVAHRHSPLAQKFGRICYDLDDQLVVHFHDNSLPPEEEVLGAVLMLEHREPWLVNECTKGGLSFKNPFGDITDGVLDASITQTIGMLVKAFGE